MLLEAIFDNIKIFCNHGKVRCEGVDRATLTAGGRVLYQVNLQVPGRMIKPCSGERECGPFDPLHADHCHIKIGSDLGVPGRQSDMMDCLR